MMYEIKCECMFESARRGHAAVTYLRSLIVICTINLKMNTKSTLPFNSDVSNKKIDFLLVNLTSHLKLNHSTK